MDGEPFLLSISLTSACPLDCPFCYSKHYPPRARWTRERLDALLGEAEELFGRGGFVAVFGGGEPTTDPSLLADALALALRHGSPYTSFTTDAALPAEAWAPRIEEALGGPLKLPRGFATLSVDGYKLLAGPRADPSRLPESDAELWRRARAGLALASARWRRPVPEEPPRVLEAYRILKSRGWDVALNVLVTDDLLPLLLPRSPESRGPDHPAMEMLWEMVRGAVQVQFLAPKPLRGLLSAVALARVAVLWWAARSPARIAADQAMHALLGMENPRAAPGRFCAAGRALVSIDPAGRVAMCSFAPHAEEWRPGRLGEILGRLRDAAPSREEGCPYLRLGPSYR